MRFGLLAIGIVAATPASAEVVSSSANGFHVREEAQLVVPAAAAYDAFARIGDWWGKGHTYSGNSANLSLSPQPGGCFCERFPAGGGVEHMRVTYVDPAKRIVMTGALGPLLYEASVGVMDVQFERVAGGAKVTLDYRASGFATGGADKLAPLVDKVLAEQMQRYRQYARPASPNP